MGHPMGRRDEIDIMATDILKLQHDLRKLFVDDNLAMTLMTDIVVLAEVTHEVAVGKKDRSRTFSPHQRCFLAKMRVIA